MAGRTRNAAVDPRLPGAPDRVPPDPLWRLRVRDLWRFVRRERLSFWLICFYLFIEYVRPQQVWRSIDVVPYGDIAIWGTLIALLLEGRFLRLQTVLSKLYIVFLAVVLLSAVMAWRPELSWANISLPLSWFVVFLLITSIVNTERRYLVFFLTFLLWSSKMSQHGFRSFLSSGFSFTSWGATGAPGWFHNSGEFGVQMCVFFPMSVYFILALRPYWERWKLALFALMPATALVSMVASSSRGALIGGAAVLLWMVARSRHRVRAFVWGAVVAAAVYVIIPQEQIDRLKESGEDDTSIARTVRWTNGIEIANQHPVLGIGYDNWLEYHRPRYGGGEPHNIFIEAWAELGYVGLFSFLALIAGTFWVNRGTRKIAASLGERGRLFYFLGHGLDGALIGYLVSGFFVTVLHYPYFWINLALVTSLRVVAVRVARQERVKRARVAPRPAAAGGLAARGGHRPISIPGPATS